MNKKDIIDAYLKIRKIDNTIPDDVLDFMKDSAIENLYRIKTKHGVFNVKPKCMYCNGDVNHDFLDGDYTLLVCENEDCLVKLRTF